MSGYAAQLEETSEETLRCFRISSFLQIHIDDFAVLVDGSPKVVLLATYFDEHFIQKVRVTKSRVPAPKTSGKFRPKFVDPKSNRFVADRNIAFSEKVLYISDAEIEAEVEPNGMLDDRRWESMTLVDVVHLGMLPEGQLICQYLYALYSWRVIPETKGKTLEQIEQHWESLRRKSRPLASAEPEAD